MRSSLISRLKKGKGSIALSVKHRLEVRLITPIMEEGVSVLGLSVADPPAADALLENSKSISTKP
jgi:hypothetical protein